MRTHILAHMREGVTTEVTLARRRRGPLERIRFFPRRVAIALGGSNMSRGTRASVVGYVHRGIKHSRLRARARDCVFLSTASIANSERRLHPNAAFAATPAALTVIDELLRDAPERVVHTQPGRPTATRCEIAGQEFAKNNSSALMAVGSHERSGGRTPGVDG